MTPMVPAGLVRCVTKVLVRDAINRLALLDLGSVVAQCFPEMSDAEIAVSATAARSEIEEFFQAVADAAAREAD